MNKPRNNAEPEIAGICPSMIDISCTVTKEQLAACQPTLDLQPGNWSKIESAEALQTVLGELDITADDATKREAEARRRKFSVAAGSSVLGIMSALHPSSRSGSFLTSAIAMREDDTIDPLFAHFRRAAQDIGVEHHGQPVQGRNPVGLVLATESDVEKILATFPGVAPELDANEVIRQHDPEYVIVDAYELQEGLLAKSIDALIHGGDFKVALSLGNREILRNKSTRERIRSYIESGKIHIVCGNRDEYSVLYPDVPPEILEDEGFVAHPIHEYVPFSLVTNGPQGITGHSEGDCAYVPAFAIRQEDIVNTSGAGDTAMGAFCDGVMRRQELRPTLFRAAYLATQVLSLPSSRITKS